MVRVCLKKEDRKGEGEEKRKDMKKREEEVDRQKGEGRVGKGRRADTVCEIRCQAYKYAFLGLPQWFLFYHVIKLLCIYTIMFTKKFL